MTAALARDTSNKVIGGVCSGLARWLGLSPIIIRAAFVLSIILPGPQVIFYLILWLVMPADDAA